MAYAGDGKACIGKYESEFEAILEQAAKETNTRILIEEAKDYPWPDYVSVYSYNRSNKSAFWKRFRELKEKNETIQIQVV